MQPKLDGIKGCFISPQGKLSVQLSVGFDNKMLEFCLD